MKAKELMIGDWVQVPSEMNRYKRVCSTFDMDLAVLYRPIPLTDAILKANGFEYHHKNFAALSYEHPFQLEMVEWPNENGIGLWMVGGLLKIRYVHEFQHAIRLCDIDKVIIIDED